MTRVPANIVTRVVIGLNVAVFAWQFFGPGFSDAALAAEGAIVPAYVLVGGQWWRLVSYAFLHAAIWHITLNMIALWQLGSIVELLVGARRMLVVYAFSGLGSGLLVVFFSGNEATVGASGAIYGLFGALISIGLRLGRPGRGLVMSMVPILAINLVLTFTVPNISIFGHLGGLITGFVVAWGIRLTPRGRRLFVPAQPVVAPALPEIEQTP